MRSTPAKVAPPRVRNALRRERLLARLDRLRRRGGAVWISGQPGAGKTTLVASWVAARRLRPLWLRVDGGDADLTALLASLAAAARALRPRLALPAFRPEQRRDAFARGFVRAVFDALPRRAVLVLDDLHELPADAPAEEALRLLVEELPAGAVLVLVGRGEPPGALARARAGGRLDLIAGRELELGPGEARALASARGVRDGGAARALNRAARGWAAGLVVLLAAGASAAPGAAVAATFDYFAGEVFEREDERSRRLLLELALLDAPTASLAGHATGDPAAPRVLARLARRGLFTLRSGGDEDPAFEFHALFRAYLLARGRDELPAGRAEAVRAAAGAALAERGGAAAEAAVGLLLDAGRVEEAARLVVREGPGLLAAGRGAALEAWLARLPPALHAAEPRLRHLAGAAALARDPAEARVRFEGALAAFEARGDAEGAWLGWAGAVEATILGWSDFTPLGPLLEDLERLRARFPFPSPRVEARVALVALAALVHGAPGHPDLSRWQEAARRLARSGGDVRTRLVAGSQLHAHAGWWLGDASVATELVGALGPLARRPDTEPAAAILWLATEAPYHSLRGDHEAAARTAAEARRLADRAGIHAWDGLLFTHAVWRALGADDVAGARAQVRELWRTVREGSAIDRAHVHALAAVVALREGDLPSARTEALAAKALAEGASYPTGHVFADVVLARALDGPAGAAALASARAKIRAIGSPPFEHVLGLVEADRAARAGDEAGALRALAGALPRAGAGAEHARYFFGHAELGRLLALALRAGVEPDAAARAARGGRVEPPPCAGEAWPWAARVRLLGRFEVARGEQVVWAAPRAPRRPFELVAAVAALGGEGVPEAAVADALWAGADADAAQGSLESALHRLRRTLDPGVVVRRDGRLSIARGRCWVDALELEARLDAGPGAAGGHDCAADRERIVALYRGPLLAGRDERWAAAARARLRRKLSRWLDALGAAGIDAGALRDRLALADPALAGPALRRGA